MTTLIDSDIPLYATPPQRQPLTDKELLRKEYKRGYADAMGWKVQNHLEHLPPQLVQADL